MATVAWLPAAVLLSLLLGGNCCLENLPRYAGQGLQGATRFPESVQALVPAYTFSCHGNITKWGAYVGPPSERYKMEFQVWRPSFKSSSCYEQVGGNSVSSEQPQSQQIVLKVDEGDQIQVQPGDIVGFYSSHLTGSGGGVELDMSISDVAVAIVDRTSIAGGVCELGRVMLGAPVITAVVATATQTEEPTSQPVQPVSTHPTGPSPSSPVPSSSSPTPSPSSSVYTQDRAQTTPPPLNPPENETETQPTANDRPSPSSTESPVVLMIAVGVAVGMAAVVITMLGLTGCILCHLHRRQRRKGTSPVFRTTAAPRQLPSAPPFAMNQSDSVPFVVSPNCPIPVSTNVAYGRHKCHTSQPIPVSNNIAYGQPRCPARALSWQLNRVNNGRERPQPPLRVVKSFSHRHTGSTIALPCPQITMETTGNPNYEPVYDTADIDPDPHLYDTAGDEGADNDSGYVINQLVYDDSETAKQSKKPTDSHQYTVM